MVENIDRAMEKINYETLAEFRYTLRRFLRQAELNARKVGLTPQQYQGLLALKGFPDRNYVTIGELAERLQLTHNTAVELADRMESQELIRRFPGPNDRRQVCVTLTERGETLLGQVAEENQEQLRCLAPELISVLQRLTE